MQQVLLLAIVGVGIVIAIALQRIAAAVVQGRRDAAVEHVIATFAPAVAAVQQDPKQLLAWYPLARISRKVHPEAFAVLDKASGATFPFSKERIEAAHARCSSDWLAWERAHDAEFSLKAAEVQNEIDRTPGQASPLLRTRLAAIEQQKLERYQQRYEEYIKTAKALAAFTE